MTSRVFACLGVFVAFGDAACAPFSAAPEQTDGGDGGPAVEGGLAGDGGTTPPSCRELLVQGIRTSGGYNVATAQGTISLYCDMTTLDGGWTLVARSAAGAANGRFGWKVATGDVGNLKVPYSLDARRIGPFTEILFGAHDGGGNWVGPVYTRQVPSTLLQEFVSGLTPEAGSKRIVDGPCTSPLTNTQPTMLSRLGYVDDAKHFTFTDSDNTPHFGLYPDGWATNRRRASPDCPYDGGLTDALGMIFVR